jgi:hypothetical protein
LETIPLQIDGQSWTLEVTPTVFFKDACGECLPDTKTLRVAPDQGPLDEADTAIHEVLHACLAHDGFRRHRYSQQTEEFFVNSLATGLARALRDNPHFLKWLSKRIKQ